MKKIIVVNLLGSSQSGKAIIASQMMGNLKKNGFNCKLIKSAAEQFSERGFRKVAEQLCVVGNPNFRMGKDRNNIDIIITDSPLVLSMFYGATMLNTDYSAEELSKLSAFCQENFDNLNFFIRGRLASDNSEDNIRALIDEQKIFDKFKGIDLNMETMLPNQYCIQQMLKEVEGKHRLNNMMLALEA